ncbi:MAG: penicillin-binding protein 2 [Leptolyngbya sp. SIO4C5]|nr:penicillin-binding protein 2 [Leptolyngbya sp. SIO4C5]
MSSRPRLAARSRRPMARKPRPRQRSRRYSPRFRALLVWSLLILSIIGLGSRLAYIQLVQGTALAQMAQQQQQRRRQPIQARHSIVDRQGNALAVDQIEYTLYAHPALFDQSASAIAAQLSSLLEQPTRQLVQQFEAQETGIKVAETLPEEISKRILELELNGLELIPNLQRFYPRGDLFAQIVGYVDVDGEGQAGLEYSLQEQLFLPQPSQAQSAQTGRQQDLALAALLAEDGLMLQLTLDSRLQRAAQLSLRRQMETYGAKRGAVLVMDAHSGAILAMAVEPTYDPNRYYEADVAAFKNWAVSDSYEPGSTFKPVNVAIALASQVIDPSFSIYDEGRIQIGEWPIQNADYAARGGRGPLSLAEVLKYSSNVGMVHIMEALAPETYFDWLQRLEIDQPTGIELPAETTGQLKEKEQFVGSRIEPATTAFGQGFALTPVQLLRLQGTLANGGKLVTPHVVSGLRDRQGQIHWQPPRPQPQPLFDAATAQQVVSMMETVVQEGTGEPAQVPGYRIAGKTGTAQKALNGYYTDARITSFVGILPVEDPRYVILAIVDEPWGDDAYGSTVAAPIVKAVTESLVAVEGIPPSSLSPETEAAE